MGAYGNIDAAISGLKVETDESSKVESWVASLGDITFGSPLFANVGENEKANSLLNDVTKLVFSTDFSASNALGGYNGLIGGFTPTTLAFNSAGLQSVVVQCNYTGLTTGQAGNLNVAGSNYFYATGCEL